MDINWDQFWDNNLGIVIRIAIIIVVAVTIARVLGMLLRRAEKRRIEKGDDDVTQFRFFRNSVSAAIYILAAGVILSVIPGGETVAVSIFAGAGIFAAIVGFASQEAFSNIVSGVFIVLFKPYRVGDIIEVGPKTGVVEDITLRHTVIRNFQNQRVIMPNSLISGDTVTNSTIVDTKCVRWIEIGISYDSDINLAKRIMQEEGEAHPLCIDNRTPEDLEKGTPKVVTRVIGFGDSSVNLRAWCWANSTPEGFVMQTDLNQSIKERFDREGIEIPFPYRTLVVKNKAELPISESSDSDAESVA